MARQEGGQCSIAAMKHPVAWLLGGVVGVGTVLYALAIGPLAHVFLPLFTVELPPRSRAT